MEISDSTVCVYYLGKVFALAPFSVRKNSKNSYEIKRSRFFTIYSALLCGLMGMAVCSKVSDLKMILFVITVFYTYRGLVFDANSKIPMRVKKMRFWWLIAVVLILATLLDQGLACRSKTQKPVSSRPSPPPSSPESSSSESKENWTQRIIPVEDSFGGMESIEIIDTGTETSVESTNPT